MPTTSLLPEGLSPTLSWLVLTAVIVQSCTIARATGRNKIGKSVNPPSSNLLNLEVQALLAVRIRDFLRDRLYLPDLLRSMIVADPSVPVLARLLQVEKGTFTF